MLVANRLFAREFIKNPNLLSQIRPPASTAGTHVFINDHAIRHSFHAQRFCKLD